MSRRIAFVTGNAHKYATARDHLSVADVEVEQVPMDLDEIQSTSVIDVATHKARSAFRVVRRPLFVEDSGLGIDELGGWPGPMLKHLLTATGASGLSHLADLTQTRACRIDVACVRVDGRVRPRSPGRRVHAWASCAIFGTCRRCTKPLAEPMVCCAWPAPGMPG
jgi:inosine/xanthosine triphosphate pyrophosphatase family protein